MKFFTIGMALSIAYAVAQNCTICQDGSALNGSVLIPFGNVTCGSLEQVAFQANGTECSTLQANAAWCECPGVQPSCTLCPDGSSPPYLDFSIEGINVTCRELEYLATVAPNEAACQDIAGFAATCGCPDSTPPFCTLCPDGQPPPVLDLKLPNHVTCGRVDAVAREETTEHGCDVLRSFASATCGCVGQVSSSSDLCTTLCPDGSQVPDPDGIVGETITGKTVTCGEVEAQAALGVQDQETCNTYALMGVYACGCENTLPALACQLCEDGSLPPNLLHDLDGKGNTCVEFMSGIMDINDPMTCTAFQGTAGVYCGCNNPVASKNICRICGGSQLLPNPQRIAQTGSEISCSEAEYVANLEGSASCSWMQENFADVCCGPEQVDPNDNDDDLPYSDDIYVDATLPPEIRPQGPASEIDEITSSAQGSFLTLAVAAVLVVAAHLL